jgi:hypothetical protein
MITIMRVEDRLIAPAPRLEAGGLRARRHAVIAVISYSLFPSSICIAQI